VASSSTPTRELAPERSETPPAVRAPARPRDIRAARPYFLTRSPLKALVRRAASIALLVLLDVCGVALGLFFALALREIYYGNTPLLWGLLWEAEKAWLPFVALVTVLVFWRAELYAPREQRAGLGRIISSVFVIAVLTLAFAVGVGHEFSTYGLVPTAAVLTICLVGLLRAAYEQVTSEVLQLTGASRQALLVGDAKELDHLRDVLGAATTGIRYEFVGALTTNGSAGGLPRLGKLRDLPRVLENMRVDEVLIGASDLDERTMLEIAEQAHEAGVKVRVAPDTTEILARRARYVPGQGIPLFELHPPVFAGTDWIVKRGFDLVVSGLVVVIGLPLWALIALAVKLSSSGPVFYRDRRVGLSEQAFSMLKFRTMYPDAAEQQPELEAENEADGALFKLRADPRVTPVGRVLRRFSLDEVPQVLNVLRGEMSLVGPRPLPLRDFRRLEDWHRKRYLVLPGMTGLWQISGRSNLGFDDLVRLDFYYLENWSLWLDVSIILKTIPAVLSRRGAY
jgi:exopolysaccharide biosynthesis polyprenyl glycosylphosphotransferase